MRVIKKPWTQELLSPLLKHTQFEKMAPNQIYKITICLALITNYWIQVIIYIILYTPGNCIYTIL